MIVDATRAIVIAESARAIEGPETWGLTAGVVQPVVGAIFRLARLELQGAHGVGDVLQRVDQAMRVVVRGVNAVLVLFGHTPQHNN